MSVCVSVFLLCLVSLWVDTIDRAALRCTAIRTVRSSTSLHAFVMHCGWLCFSSLVSVRKRMLNEYTQPVPCDEDHLAAVNIPITILAKYFNQASPEEVSSSDSTTTQDEEA